MPQAHAVQAPTVGRVSLPDSIRDVPASAPAGATSPHVARSTLTIGEMNTSMEFSLSLKMRNFAELKARLARGEVISPAEMADRYWPLPTDYDAAATWLTQQGFTLSTTNSSHFLVTATGTVAQVQGAFQVNFARVASDGVDFSSAVTAPSVPASLAPALVGVNGLQPHLRKRPHLLHPNSATGFVPPFFPNQIKQAYGAGSLNLDGTGQTIAIVMSAYPSGNNASNTTNLANFWTTTGITRTGTYTPIAIGSGPNVSSSNIAAEEACLDVEWSGAIAPGANIRLYGTSSLASVALDQAYQQIYNDAIAHPEYGLHVVSLSYGGLEASGSQLQTDDQLFAQLVSAGITVFASSGDDGSSQGAESPASDPHVTGVGGTSIFLNSTTGVVTSETAWSGSGGNVSGFFQKPSWQAGNGLSSATNMRQVPDISAPADPSTGCLIVWNNNASTTVGGTSWSAPTWAGFAALINQARAQNHAPPLGFLNPKLYPLQGSSSYRDITSGSNGNFSALAGYDLVTGLGVPVFPNLLNQLIVALDAPANAQVDSGQNATFTCNVGDTITTFLWQRLAAGTTNWVNLADSATYTGTTTGTLTIMAANGAMSGDQFRCSTGVGITPGGTLVVIAQPLYVSTLAGQLGVPGTSDGQGTNAQFDYPNDVALDSHGNIFVADTNNDAVRMVTPSGNVTTFAGTPGQPGYLNLNGTAARFNFINSIDFDSGGNIYLADSNNNAIRKITPAGNVTTFAGSATGVNGTINAVGTNARFNFPAGLAVATNGNLYIADSNNNLIRKITANGTVSTLAGSSSASGFANGNGTSARFDFPAAVVVDSTGNIFVADANNNIIRKITPSGNVTTFAGSALEQGVADGPGAFARFNYPSGIAIDSADNLYVTDTNNNAIRKITPAGMVSTLAGQAGIQGIADGVGSAAQFNQPYGVVVNNATGVIYIADLYNHAIRQIRAMPQLQSQSGDVVALAGQAANFSVTANGIPPPSFQWQRWPAGGAGWANLTNNTTYQGATSATLSINSATADMDGDQFQCVITNSLSSITSTPATLTVQVPPAFTLQPVDQAVTVGDDATFAVAAFAQPRIVSYRWQMQLSGNAGWVNLSDNATFTDTDTATFTIHTADASLDGAQFRAVASNGVNPDAISSAATLTVYPSGYQIWAANLNLSGSAAQLSAKPFGDTIPNLARFAMNLGANPAPGDLPSLSTQVVNGIAYLTLSYSVNKDLVGVQVVPEYSSDLRNWQPVSAGITVQVVDPNSHTAHYEVQVAVPANGLVFLRLVIQPAP